MGFLLKVGAKILHIAYLERGMKVKSFTNVFILARIL